MVVIQEVDIHKVVIQEVDIQKGHHRRWIPRRWTSRRWIYLQIQQQHYSEQMRISRTTNRYHLLETGILVVQEYPQIPISVKFKIN